MTTTILPLPDGFAYQSAKKSPKVQLILVFLTLLVSLIHLWIINELTRKLPEIKPAKPLIMEVSLLAPPASKSIETVATAPNPVAPIEQTKPELEKPKPEEKRPLVKKIAPPKKKPLLKKKPEPLPQEKHEKPVLDKATLDQSISKAIEKVVSSTATASPQTSSSTATFANTGNPNPSADKFVPASRMAGYGSRTSDFYPRRARERGLEGKVLLKIKISADGSVEEVSVSSSSGHDILDEAAAAAVEKWKFIPAKRGETPVASTVIVPINFKLD